MTAPRYDIDGLSRLLSKTVGDDKATSAVRTAAREVGLAGKRDLSVDEALSVLEKVAETPGIVGVTARFAKSRLHLAAR